MGRSVLGVTVAAVLTLLSSTPADAASAPGVPGGVTATATGSGTIKISWNGVSGATSYVVSNGDVSSQNLASTSYTWGGLAPGTYMCFTVTAKNSSGQSAWSPYACATTAVPAPTGVTARATSSGTVRISWTDQTGGQGVYVVSNGDVSAPGDLSAGSTWYDWTGIAPGTYMCFTVAAKEGIGQSPWSAYSCVTTPSASGDTYVNLGDSISAGEGTYNPYLAGTDTSTNKCHRSANSYSAQYVAASTRYHAVKNVACSGATTSDIVTPAGAVNKMSIPSAGEPEQVSALSASTQLVTVTIGANNLNLGGIFTTCYGKVTFPAIDDCFASSLSDDFITKTIPYTLENWTGYGPSLGHTYAAIRKAAPNATVVVLTYAQIFPATSPGDTCNTLPQTMVSQANLTRIRRVVSAMNAEVKAAAATYGFTVLDEENALAGHEECEPNTWVNPLNAFGQDDEDLHPTVAGYAKEAADIKAYLDAIV